jgi:hypothetical protein
MPLGFETGNYSRVSASFTRPNDTTAYAASDVVCNSTSAPAVLTFSGMARSLGGSGRVLTARHVKNSTGTTNASFRLWLYRTAPTAINDNAQWPLLWANRANRLGFADFSHTTGGTGSDSTSSIVTFAGIDYICDSAAVDLYGVLIATAAYTPTAQEQHFIELGRELF